MASLRDLLRRFRPVASPGPAARAGAPTDREGAIRAELAPVFAALDRAQADAEATVREARAEAERARARATAEAQRMIAEARQRAAADRAEAATARLRGIERERDEAMEAAEREVEDIRARSAEHMDGLVERVIERVLSAAAEDHR